MKRQNSVANLLSLKIYSVEEVLAQYRNWDPVRDGKDQIITIDGKDWKVKMTSQRYAVFSKSIVCANCGMVADHFRLQYSRGSEKPRAHWNLFATIKDANGNESLRLFTKDHIIPKSKGGKDILDNYQTMCEYCNSIKGNKMPEEGPKRISDKVLDLDITGYALLTRVVPLAGGRPQPAWLQMPGTNDLFCAVFSTKEKAEEFAMQFGIQYDDVKQVSDAPDFMESIQGNARLIIDPYQHTNGRIRFKEIFLDPDNIPQPVQ